MGQSTLGNWESKLYGKGSSRAHGKSEDRKQPVQWKLNILLLPKVVKLGMGGRSSYNSLADTGKFPYKGCAEAEMAPNRQLHNAKWRMKARLAAITSRHDREVWQEAQDQVDRG